MISFVGAGPGDPELITVKGMQLLKEADVIVYAGSLVNPAVLCYAKDGCEVHNSASMTLDEVIHKLEEGEAQGLSVVRLHTGDPAIYGAIKEQMDILARKGISYRVVPGVSSFLAAAAALQVEYTLPSVTQTVIVTRMEGRTGVPEKEKLSLLASHQATMCIFLSVHMMADVVRELLSGGYPKETPIAVVQKASWPEQKIIRGTLQTIAAQMEEEGVERTAMIVVGNCLGNEYELSRLYAPEFGHMFRDAT